MTMYLPAVVGFLTGGVGVALSDMMGTFQGIHPIPLFLGCMLLGRVVHWVSPVPHYNGGMGMGEPKPQQWGFTTEPMEDE